LRLAARDCDIWSLIGARCGAKGSAAQASLPHHNTPRRYRYMGQLCPTQWSDGAKLFHQRLRISQFKLILFTIRAPVLAFRALAIAVLVGSVIATVLGSILILGTLGLFLKAAFHRK